MTHNIGDSQALGTQLTEGAAAGVFAAANAVELRRTEDAGPIAGVTGGGASIAGACIAYLPDSEA